MNGMTLFTTYKTNMQSVSHNVGGAVAPYYKPGALHNCNKLFSGTKMNCQRIFWLKKSNIYGYLNCKAFIISQFIPLFYLFMSAKLLAV